MKITIIGTGYVGIVSGACLSEFGHDVVCVDNDAAKIAALCQGQIPIFDTEMVKGGRMSLENLKTTRRLVCLEKQVFRQLVF